MRAPPPLSPRLPLPLPSTHPPTADVPRPSRSPHSAGTTRDFTADARAVFTLGAASGGGCSQLAGTATAARTISAISGATCTSATVHARVPSLSTELVGSTTVPVVTFQSLQLAALPYPSFAGSADVALTSLRRLGCTAAYQHAQLRALARLR